VGRRILVTGGAGFIGAHVTDELIRSGYSVRVLDDLVAHVHGESRARPAHLDAEVELVLGDVRDPQVVARAVHDVDAVFHLASLVGVGQSMYRIADYTAVNDLGTARLLEALARSPVERLVVASSMSVYGEGLYRDEDGQLYDDVRRETDRLELGEWEPHGPDGRPLRPTPTPEGKRASPESIYALGKYQQEQSCLIVGRAYRIPTVVLRLFNVYGPRQALSNPYTGVLGIFAARYLSGRPPVIFEDGEQRRDLVSVYDVARACRLALEVPDAPGQTLNIGSGEAHTVRDVARMVGRVLGRDGVEPEVTGEYRSGDIRHCYADIRRARELLGYEPRVELEAGLAELAGWIVGELTVARSGANRGRFERRASEAKSG
jgi:dTDP-L-rhamnose 4-epimerase